MNQTPLLGFGIAVLVIGLAGCASSTHRAPVEDRMPVAATQSAAAPATPMGTAATTSPPANGTAAVPGAGVGAAPAGAASAPETASARPSGAESAGQPGYYTVKVGDTLVRIGLETGQNWRDIARWNSIENPNVLEVGTVLRVTPPAAEVGVATTRPVAPAPRIESRPLEARPAAPAPGSSATSSGTTAATPAPGGPASSAPGPGAAAAPTAPAPVLPPAPREADGEINWGWPASGPVTTTFDELRSKGLSIAGKAGDPVLAAADGRVVYAGSGLRGYGNLVIVKHNATFLTAYAHNQALLVKEDQVVRRGQKIAEMGASDTDRVQLHFEVRRLGKPVDPARLLPPR